MQFSSLFNLGVGNGLSSQAVARQVFSLLWVFTTVFGMGTGGFLMLGHRRIFYSCDALWKLHNDYKLRNHQSFSVCLRLGNLRLLRDFRFRYSHNSAFVMFRVLPVLLIASLRRHCTPSTVFRKSPRPISISRLKMLPSLHLWPIYVVFCHGTY